jgi:predicted transcriptional regulator
MHLTDTQKAMLAYLQSRKTPIDSHELAKRFKCSHATAAGSMRALMVEGLVHRHYEIKLRTGAWRASKVWYYNATEKLPNQGQRKPRKVVKEKTQFAFHNPFNIGAQP